MTNNLIQYVIKNENGVPTGNPISFENFLQYIEDKTSRVNQTLVTDNGYFPFNMLQKPQDTTRQQVQDNGLVIGEDGYVINEYVMVDKAIADTDMTAILNEKLVALKQSFEEASKRPRVDTGLGFFVDGGYSDLTNFQIGKELGLLVIKDADNIEHSIAIEDYDTILSAIKTKGLSLIQSNWEFKKLLNSIDLTLDTALIEIDAIGK